MSGGRQRRILMVNLHSAHNVGDAVLLETAVQQLRQAFPGCRITLAMNDPAYRPADPDVDVVPSLIAAARPYRKGSGDRWRLPALACAVAGAALDTLWLRLFGRHWPWLRGGGAALQHAYTNADLVVSCPGNVLFTMGRLGLPFLFSLAAMAQAVALRKPLYVMPQTVGPLTRAHERRLVCAVLSRARLVFVREPTSRRVLDDIGVPAARVRLVPDMAFAYRAGTDAAPSDALARFGLAAPADGPLVGVTVINRILRRVPDGTWQQYERTMAAVLSTFVSRHGASVVFVPQVTGPGRREDDRVAAHRVVALMPSGRERTLVIDDVLTAASLRPIYAAMDVFLATRMHSAIFAMTAGVPALAIEYLGKTEGMMRMAGMDDWVLGLDHLDADVLLSRLEALFARRRDLSAHLAAVVPRLAIAAGSVGSSIAEDVR